MDINPGGTLVKFKGDTNIYPVVIANADNEPTVSITSGDVGTLYGIAIGATGTITGTLNDALQASGGAINFTVSNAVFRGPSMSAQHAAFASATGNWDCFSSDGTMSPIGITRS